MPHTAFTMWVESWVGVSARNVRNLQKTNGGLWDPNL